MKKVLLVSALISALMVLAIGTAQASETLPLDTVAESQCAMDAPSVWYVAGHALDTPITVTLEDLHDDDGPAMLFQVEVWGNNANGEVFAADAEGDFEFKVPTELVGEYTVLVVFDMNRSVHCNSHQMCPPKPPAATHSIVASQADPIYNMLNCTDELLWEKVDPNDPVVVSLEEGVYYPTNPPSSCKVEQGNVLWSEVAAKLSIDADLPEDTQTVAIQLEAYCETRLDNPENDYQGNIQVYIKDADYPWGWNNGGMVELNFNTYETRTFVLSPYLSEMVLNGPVDLKFAFSSRFPGSVYRFDKVRIIAVD